MPSTFYDHLSNIATAGMIPLQSARLLGYVSALTITRVTTGRLMSVSGTIPTQVGFPLCVCVAHMVNSHNLVLQGSLLFASCPQPYA